MNLDDIIQYVDGDPVVAYDSIEDVRTCTGSNPEAESILQEFKQRMHSYLPLLSGKQRDAVDHFLETGYISRAYHANFYKALKRLKSYFED